jgi:phenylacetate-CoA ligase
MLRALYRHLLIPAFDSGLKRRKTFQYWRELERSQWLDEASLKQLQLQRLRDLLLHAQSHSAYYRDAWERLGLRSDSLTSLADFTRWTLMDRDTIRQHRSTLQVPDMGPLITKSTGGSSGVPLTFDLDTNSNDRRMAAWHRGYGWASAAPGTKQFYLWGTTLSPRSRVATFKESLWNRLHRKTLVNSFDLTEQTAADIAGRIARCRPDAIVAYVKPLYHLARCLDEQGIRPYSPGSIVVGAEKLYDFERELIERVFRAPVYETYGSREFMLIAAECDQHRGLHLTAEHLLVELLDDGGHPVEEGHEGNVVITDLFNYGMPFIRYQTGDRAIASNRPCACGRGLPKLSRIVGRQLDVIRTPDGRLIPGEFFPHLMKDFACVRQFQVVQETAHALRVRVVADDRFSSFESLITGMIRQQVGPAMSVAIDRVTSIDLTAAGKRRVVVSNLSQTKAA